MALIKEKSIDMVLCDLPYGVTDLEWDSVIPLDLLWEQYKRIVRPNGWIVLTGQNPFTAQLITSNLRDYVHQWIWEKSNGTNPFLAKYQPIKNFEDVVCFRNSRGASNDYDKSHPLRGYAQMCVDHINRDSKQLTADFKDWYPGTAGTQWSHFLRPNSLQFKLPSEKTYQLFIDNYKLNEMMGFRGYNDLKKEQNGWKKRKNERTYNPQMVGIKPRVEKIKPIKGLKHIGDFKPKDEGAVIKTERYPKAIIKFKHDKEKFHPTQKPQALFEYLIKTYTNEGDTVLDSCMGSGTTAVAAIATGRNFIGFEISEEYFKIANKRIEDLRRIVSK